MKEHFFFDGILLCMSTTFQSWLIRKDCWATHVIFVDFSDVVCFGFLSLSLSLSISLCVCVYACVLCVCVCVCVCVCDFLRLFDFMIFFLLLIQAFLLFSFRERKKKREKERERTLNWVWWLEKIWEVFRDGTHAQNILHEKLLIIIIIIQITLS